MGSQKMEGLGILGIVGTMGIMGILYLPSLPILPSIPNIPKYKAQCDRNDNRNKPFHTETFLLEEQMLQIKGFKFREEYRNAPLFSKCSFPDYTTIR